MSRALCLQGLPNADDIHCNFLPFKVQQLDDVANPASQPSGSTPGQWALSADYGYILCVTELSLRRYSGVHRRWKTRFSMSGKYRYQDAFGAPGALIDFSFDTGTDPAVDVVRPAHSGDERYLGHGRVLFQADSGTVDSHATCFASVNLGCRSTLTGSPIFNPANLDLPHQTFDADPYDAAAILYPLVLYSNALNAYYIKTAANTNAAVSSQKAAAGMTIRNALDTATLYGITWNAGPPSGDPNSMVLNAIFNPFPDIPGNLSWAEAMFDPSAWAPTIDEFILSISPTSSTGFFPHKTLTNTNPVWDVTSGAQLITPVPLVQN